MPNRGLSRAFSSRQPSVPFSSLVITRIAEGRAKGQVNLINLAFSLIYSEFFYFFSNLKVIR